MAHPAAASYKVAFNPAAARFFARTLTDRPEQLSQCLATQFDDALGRAAVRLTHTRRVHVTNLERRKDDGLDVQLAFTDAGQAVLSTRAANDDTDAPDALADLIDAHFKKQNGWSINKCAVTGVTPASDIKI